MHYAVKNTRLREIRKASGATQQEVADYLNMSRGAYQYLETKGILTGDILIKLSRFFNVSIEDLMDTNPTRLGQPDATKVVHIVLTDDEKELLELYRQLSFEEKLRMQGYVAGRIEKSKSQ